MADGTEHAGAQQLHATISQSAAICASLHLTSRQTACANFGSSKNAHATTAALNQKQSGGPPYNPLTAAANQKQKRRRHRTTHSLQLAAADSQERLRRLRSINLAAAVSKERVRRRRTIDSPPPHDQLAAAPGNKKKHQSRRSKFNSSPP